MAVAAIYQIETIYNSNDMLSLRYEQTADGVVLTVIGRPPQRLRRFDHNYWIIDNAPIGIASPKPGTASATATANHTDQINGGYTEQDYQYAVTAVDGSTGRESEPTDTNEVQNDLGTRPGSPLGNFNTITWAAVTGAELYRVYRLKNGSYGFIGTTPGGTTTFIDDNILPDFTDAPPDLYNPINNADYPNDWPATVTFHNRRMFLGRTPKRPATLFGSQTDDLFNFDKSRPLRATDSIELNLLGRRINAIRHLVSMGDLVAFTTDGLFSLKGSADVGLTPTSIQSKTEGYQGSGNTRPEIVNDVGFYTTARDEAVRTLGYAFERDGYRGNDVTVFARHFFTGFKIVAFAWCAQPSSVLYVLRNDGKIVALTWEAEQEVWGWTLLYTDGGVESMCSVSEEGRDVLYAVIARQIGGETHRYVERLSNPHWIDENWSAQQDAVIMDSAVSYKGEATRGLKNIWWLEGRDVSVFADGLVQKGHSVVNGRLTPDLPEPATTITVGLGYEAYAWTLPLVVTGNGGTTKGRKQAAANAVLEVLNTRGLKIAPSHVEPDAFGSMKQMVLPPGSKYASTTPTPLYSGELNPQGLGASDWNKAVITVAQTDPLPFVVTGIATDVEFGG